LHIIHFYKQRIKTKPYIALQNKTLGVPSNKLAENIPILRLKVEGKKVEGNASALNPSSHQPQMNLIRIMPA
jgi:hypothetical protein